MNNIMKGKKGIILGVANNKSIAWKIARVLKEQGATLGYTYQDEVLSKKAIKLFKENDAEFFVKLDVTKDEEFENLKQKVERKFDGEVDFVVHSLAGGPDLKDLSGNFFDIKRENFLKTMEISVFSFVRVLKVLHPFMKNRGSSAITLSHLGATRTVPNYNVMGVAKAALESSARYMANNLGMDGIRVNVLSPGPILTRAASGVSGFRQLMKEYVEANPLKKAINTTDVANSALFLLSDLSKGTTGQILFVDGGFNIK